MENPTHFPVEYASVSYLKTRGVWKVEAEFPNEAFPLFMDLIGKPPNAGESKWLAIAVLEKPTEG